MNKKKILFKDELRGKIMKEFVSRRSKKYSYLMNDDGKYEKAKLTKKCVTKTETKFNDYKN